MDAEREIWREVEYQIHKLLGVRVKRGDQYDLYLSQKDGHWYSIGLEYTLATDLAFHALEQLGCDIAIKKVGEVYTLSMPSDDAPNMIHKTVPKEDLALGICELILEWKKT